MNQLTRAEEEVMQVLWKLEKAFVKEVLEEFAEPQPAYNTLSTIVRILEQKEFVAHEAIGRSHRYYPLISKEAYSASSLKKLTRNYFGGSFKALATCFVKDGNLSVDDLEAIREMIEKNESKEQ